MEKFLLKALNQLNRDFYQQISTDFSESRNFAWSGWSRVLPHLAKNRQVKILDLACGNGRLVEFLEQNLTLNFLYLGLDNSNDLLKIATSKYSKHQFTKFDLVENYLQNKKIILPSTEKFDLIAIFGLSHHLFSLAFRKELLSTMRKYLADDGIIVISNWQFAKEKNRFEKNILSKQKIIRNPKINLWQKIKLLFLLLNLQKNDFLLDWRKGANADKAFRYCHQIDEAEMKLIAKGSGLKLIDQFFADGKSAQLNQYFIFKRERL